MTDLAPCPRCARHVRPGDACCPFCGGDASGAVPLPARPVSRRAFTRAAIMCGAAVLTACGGEPAREDDDVADGERTGGGERDFSSDRDTGEGRDTHVRDDGADDEEARRLAEERERQRRLEEQRRLDDRHYQRHREVPQCVRDGTCPAPPYGTPPARETLI